MSDTTYVAIRREVDKLRDEVDRLTAERDAALASGHEFARLAGATAAERDRLRDGIEVHKFRKAERRCYPKPGHELKYGCWDHDMRLWSLLDR